MGKVGYYSAASAIIGMQTALDVTANNVANINTNGYKATRPDFADLLYTEKYTNEEVHYGHGMKVDKTDIMYEQSSLRNTERMLDFAALDDGFFAVQTVHGDIRYTKDGSFYAFNDGYLYDSNGGNVLDYDGNPIVIPLDENNMIDYSALGKLVGTYRFENPYGLDADGLNYYASNGSSGEAVADNTIKKKQGFIEASSTNLANEMSHVIEYQRAFQLNVSILKIHDQLEDRVNNLRS